MKNDFYFYFGAICKLLQNFEAILSLEHTTNTQASLKPIKPTLIYSRQFHQNYQQKQLLNRYHIRSATGRVLPNSSNWFKGPGRVWVPRPQLQINPLSLKNNRLKFQVFTTGTHPFIRIYVEYSLPCQRKAKISQHITGWTWKQLGSWPTMLKILPETLDTHTCHKAEGISILLSLCFHLTRLLYNRTHALGHLSVHPSIHSTYPSTHSSIHSLGGLPSFFLEKGLD